MWGGLYILNYSAFVAFLSWELEKLITGDSKLFFQYTKYIALFLSIYNVVCYIRGQSWSLFNRDLTATIIAIGFGVFLVHNALNHKR